MKCSHCGKELKQDEWVFLGIKTQRVRCETCARNSQDVSQSDLMVGDFEWRPANIKDSRKNDNKK